MTALLPDNLATLRAYLRSLPDATVTLSVTAGQTTIARMNGVLCEALSDAMLSRPGATVSAVAEDPAILVSLRAPAIDRSPAQVTHIVALATFSPEWRDMLLLCRRGALSLPLTMPLAAVTERHPAAVPVRARGATRQAAAFAAMRATAGRLP